jgi:N-acetyl-gamma-glutamyl-phosphate reductase
LTDAHDVVIVAASGPSGAGRSLKPHLLGSELMGSAAAYGVGGVHRHTPELQQNFRACGATAPTVSFTPVLVPMSRGILATVTAPLAPGADAAAVRAAWETAYAAEPFVELRQGPVGVIDVRDTNYARLSWHHDPRTGRVIVFAAIDNLWKGASSQAVQNLNLMFGLDESMGLPA